jgi:hypothetical protein
MLNVCTSMDLAPAWLVEAHPWCRHTLHARPPICFSSWLLVSHRPPLCCLLPAPLCCLQRRAWFNYSKRLAKIAAGVSKWVQRLQQYSVQATGAMATNASQALQVCVPWWHAACASLVTALLRRMLDIDIYPASARGSFCCC